MAVDGIVTDNFELDVSTDDDRLRVQWKGRANERRPAATLNPFFERLIEAAKASSARIEFDMSELEHISSSTIVVIVQLLKKLDAERLPIMLEYDDSVSWQHMTFDALRYLSGPDKMLELKTRAGG
jgi:hypothetical protein